MKSKFLIILFSCIMAFACNDAYFDEYPEDSLTEGVFYRQASDFEQALNAAYLSLRSTYELFFAFGDVASDDAFNWKNNNSFDLISINESNVSNDNGILRTHWNASYATIARCNIVLGRIGNVSFDEGVKTRLIGEARFLRALAYFDLVRVFGGVPLVESEIKKANDAFTIGREDENVIYDFIVSDLMAASRDLPEVYDNNADIGRATSVAAKTLMGKVYLTQKKYQEAAEQFEQVINSGKYGLLENYVDIFEPENPNNSEVIFAVQYARNANPSQGSAFGNRTAPNEPVGRNIVSAGSGFGQFHITDDLMNAFIDQDKRLLMVDSAIGVSLRKYYFTTKYLDPAMVNPSDAANDWIVLRYADVLLMMSEARNELGQTEEAIPYLNLVRKRAGLESVENSIDQSFLRRAIENERRLEFNCEGHRWFDLVRTGRAIEVMNRHFLTYSYDEMQVGINSSIQEHELIFPIPNAEILLNPDRLHQNPGY